MIPPARSRGPDLGEPDSRRFHQEVKAGSLLICLVGGLRWRIARPPRLSLGAPVARGRGPLQPVLAGPAWGDARDISQASRDANIVAVRLSAGCARALTARPGFGERIGRARAGAPPEHLSWPAVLSETPVGGQSGLAQCWGGMAGSCVLAGATRVLGWPGGTRVRFRRPRLGAPVARNLVCRLRATRRASDCWEDTRGWGVRDAEQRRRLWCRSDAGAIGRRLTPLTAAAQGRGAAGSAQVCRPRPALAGWPIAGVPGGPKSPSQPASGVRGAGGVCFGVWGVGGGAPVARPCARGRHRIRTRLVTSGKSWWRGRGRAEGRGGSGACGRARSLGRKAARGVPGSGRWGRFSGRERQSCSKPASSASAPYIEALGAQKAPKGRRAFRPADVGTELCRPGGAGLGPMGRLRGYYHCCPPRAGRVRFTGRQGPSGSLYFPIT